MDLRLLIIDLAEKIGLVASAGLLTVLVPPLRNRLLGIGGQPQDRLAAFLLGLLLSMWGAKLGQMWLGLHVNVHAIGILIAAILGGSRTGLVTGLAAGTFYLFRADGSLGVVGLLADAVLGWTAGVIKEKRPIWWLSWRAFPVAFVVLGVSIIGVTLGLLVVGRDGVAYFIASPAHLVQLAGNAAGAAVFVGVTRVVLAREEAAVALIQAKAAADQLELQALRSRLEPHFLFNALNTLRATIRTNPELARDLVSDLADLYRYLLHHPHDAALEKEVEHACAYLAIERARLGGDRFHVVTDIDTEVKFARVPALLLQPLVENAVKYGVAINEGPAEVSILAERVDEQLRISVLNYAEGNKLGEAAVGSGVALQTLRERLERQFGLSATLMLNTREQGAVAQICLPWSAVRPDADAMSERSTT